MYVHGPSKVVASDDLICFVCCDLNLDFFKETLIYITLLKVENPLYIARLVLCQFCVIF